MPSTPWEAVTLRAAIATQTALPITTDLYTLVFGEACSRQEDRPREGIRVQVGESEGAELRVTISPILVDVIINPINTVQSAMAFGIAHLGELKAELAKFEKRIQAFLPKWEVPTTRLSLLVTARTPAAKDRADAYNTLAANLRSVKLDPARMSDFIFRANVRAPTKLIPEGFYNRLTTWSATNIQAAAGTAPGQPETVVLDQHFAQVEMDINTPSGRREPLPRDKMGPIYQELFQLAAEIGTSGEPV